MVRQNRVDPMGTVRVLDFRGAWMGNRGILHDDAEQVRQYQATDPGSSVSCPFVARYHAHRDGPDHRRRLHRGAKAGRLTNGLDACRSTTRGSRTRPTTGTASLPVWPYRQHGVPSRPGPVRLVEIRSTSRTTARFRRATRRPHCCVRSALTRPPRHLERRRSRAVQSWCSGLVAIVSRGRTRRELSRGCHHHWSCSGCCCPMPTTQCCSHTTSCRSCPGSRPFPLARSAGWVAPKRSGSARSRCSPGPTDRDPAPTGTRRRGADPTPRRCPGAGPLKRTCRRSRRRP